MPQAKMIYMFCLILLDDAFFFLFPDKSAAIECDEEEVLNLDALWEETARAKKDVALTLNMDNDWIRSIVVCSLLCFIVVVRCAGMNNGSRWKCICVKV